jgi:hypothetical protein
MNIKRVLIGLDLYLECMARRRYDPAGPLVKVIVLAAAVRDMADQAAFAGMCDDDYAALVQEARAAGRG